MRVKIFRSKNFNTFLIYYIIVLGDYMKKFILFILIFFIGLSFVKANEIYSIDVSVELDENGNGFVTEVWDMYVNQGTEVYKPMGDLGNSKITNFHVTDERGNSYNTLSSWNTSGTLDSKAYKNGINYTSDGIELCWGMSSYGNHTYTITYDVSNMIYVATDAEVLYWKFINDSMNPAPKKFTVTVSGPKYYENTLDVWGYGYEGYAYVANGVISMSNIENRNFKSNEYAVLLVKYPLNTFNTNNSISKFETFDDFHKQAEKGSFSYNYNTMHINIFTIIITIISNLFWPFLIFFVIFKGAKSGKDNYIKKPLKDVNNFRDIPCDKDIFKAYFLSTVYKLNSKKEDLLGAILLKWIRDGQIKIIKQEKKNLLNKKEITALDLTKPLEGTSIEAKLYNMLVDASQDKILEENELKKWCKNHYSKFFKWFDDVMVTIRTDYINSGNITVTESGKVFKTKIYNIDDRLHEEAIKLAGLKKYLKEFSRIKEKEPIEVMLWQEYLIFAQIFGIAKEVSNQFKKLYPEIFEDSTYNINYSDILWINTITYSGISSASSARSAAQSYSSGGGGFSSGGGGGGSFGGGFGGGTR